MKATVGDKTILDRIVEARRLSVAHRKRAVPEAALKMAVAKAEPPRDFMAALTRNTCNIIAECKKASPSKGLLREDYSAAKLAPLLQAGGAAALSVLTEEEFFLGSLEDLIKAKKNTHIPILRKDFIFDSWQVWETRAAGADTFLLIVAVLADEQLRELIELGRSLHMEPLVEVHSLPELERAKAVGARIIGVNNRDLRTFEVGIETSLELVPRIPDDCVAISESGLNSRSDLDRLRSAGFDSFLIGEHFMRYADPGQPLRELIGSQNVARTAQDGTV